MTTTSPNVRVQLGTTKAVENAKRHGEEKRVEEWGTEMQTYRLLFRCQGPNSWRRLIELLLGGEV